MAIPQDFIHHYKFEDAPSNVLTDEVSSVGNGLFLGGAFAPAKFDNGIHCDGSSQGAEVPVLAHTTTGDASWSLSMWADINFINGQYNPIFMHEQSGASSTRIRMFVYTLADGITLTLGGFTTTVPMTLPTGEAHWVLQYDSSSDTLEVWVDSVKHFSGVTGQAGFRPTAATDTRVLRIPDHYGVTPVTSDGWFDQLYVYNRLLSQSEITELYTEADVVVPPTPIEPGPLLGTIGTAIGNFNWWDIQAGPPPIAIPDATVFLEFEAEPLVDSGVGNNNISHQGEIIPISSGATDGLHGEYLDFTGLVTTGNTYGAGPRVNHLPISINNATVTYSVWFKGFAPASSAWVSSRLVCRGDPSINSYRQGIEIVPDGRVRGRSYDDNNASYILETTLPVDSNWHHVLFRQVGTTLSFWVDGVRIPDTIMPSYSTATMNNFIEIGHQTRQDSPAVPLERGQYGGKLDSVEVWDNIILTDEQAEAVYTQG